MIIQLVLLFCSLSLYPRRDEEEKLRRTSHSQLHERVALLPFNDFNPEYEAGSAYRHERHPNLMVEHLTGKRKRVEMPVFDTTTL